MSTKGAPGVLAVILLSIALVPRINPLRIGISKVIAPPLHPLGLRTGATSENRSLVPPIANPMIASWHLAWVESP